jgi:hypothetical protein
MIFKAYNSEVVARAFFNCYFFGSLFSGLIALYGFVSGAGVLSTLSGFFYIVIVSLLSLNKRFRRNPFSILFCFFTFLYLTIPATFILVEGGDYIYGDGLASTPFAQSDYQESLPFGFLYLSVFWVAVWLGIISAGASKHEISQKSFSSIKLMPILLLGVIVLAVTWIDNQDFANVQLHGTEKITSLLAFIFFDHAYLIMAGSVLFFKLNESKYMMNSREITTLISVIFIGFILMYFISTGSKAAILTIFILLAFYPFCFSREYPHTRVSLPPIKFLVMLALLSPPLFYLALIQRINLSNGVAPDLNTLLADISKVDASAIYDISSQILYRLSWGGIDRFLLIFQSFVIDTVNSDTSREFVIYLAKNTLNLLLPGTPFQEAYAPSSQLFPSVIWNQTMNGNIVTTDLLLSLNTQPYTIFGIFTIIFGLAAPVFLYFFVFIFAFIYKKINGSMIKISLLYFFSAALSSYGIEVVIGNSVHLFVSILLMYFLLKIFSRFHTKPAVQTTGSVSA